MFGILVRTLQTQCAVLFFFSKRPLSLTLLLLTKVDNLFTSLLQNGLDMYWQKPEVSGTLRNNWRHCLKKKYWEFAGDYHGFKGRWFPFRYSTSHDVLKLKLAPPVTGKKVGTLLHSICLADRLILTHAGSI